MGRAHVEHVAHVCDAGRVESQRLVERRRVLPSRERVGHTTRGEVRAGRRKALGDNRAGRRRARIYRLGADARRGHLEHGGHRGDAGRIEAQRLVERPCVLPSRNEGIRCGVRCCGPADRRWRATATQGACRGESDCRSGTDHTRSVPRTCSSCI
eukprot:scaffold42367_cov61-Phaeocystis_antarctica.AAC.5